MGLPSTQAFPTPAEVIAELQLKNAEVVAKNQVALFDLNEAVTERPGGFNPFARRANTFRGLTDRLRAARKDADVRAVLMTLGTGSSLNIAQMAEVRREMDALRRAGKRVFVYADSYSLSDFYLASAATDICMLAGGDSLMPGIGIETMFYAGMFEKIGVKADYVQIGEYKGADEAFTRTEPSEELKGELEKLTKGLYDEIVNTISKSRSLPAREVREAIDQAILSAQEMKDRGMVDHLVDIDGLRALIADELGGPINVQHNYGKPEARQIDFSNPFTLLASLAKEEPKPKGDKVAVVYAQGVIVDGTGSDGGGLPIPLVGGGEVSIGSEDIRTAMRTAVRDPDIKAIVIRIDSPGGSALASEAMWQAVRRVAAEKPVVVSIGSMAASGGYYLASAGDTIYAEPAAIVGSIGVVGGKLVLSGVYEKLGLTTASFTQGRNADLFSSSKPFDERQKRIVRNMMKSTYDQFTDRILTTRKDKIKDFDKVARGRIFIARQAIDLGMVDQLGGLDDAIADSAQRAGLEAGSFTVIPLPETPTFREFLAGGRLGSSKPIDSSLLTNLGVAAFFNALPQDSQQMIRHQLQFGQLLQRRPVVLLAPFVVRFD